MRVEGSAQKEVASYRSGLSAFWSLPVENLLRVLATSEMGLSAEEAAVRLGRFGPNTLGQRQRSSVPRLLLRQFTSPIILILIAAACLSKVSVARQGNAADGASRRSVRHLRIRGSEPNAA